MLNKILSTVERGFAAAQQVEAAVENHAGHSKEIDHALERIAAIERHLGITKKITA